MLVTVSTIKDSLDGVRQFVARNKAGGVDHLIIFLDDGDESLAATLSADPHVTAVPAGERWWQGRRPAALNARQAINANAAMQLLAPLDWARWLFHIDGDECLQIDRRELAELSPDVRALKVSPWEAVSRKRWPDGRVTHFKRLLDDDELALLHTLGIIERPRNLHYFRGHLAGKPGTRPAADLWLSMHNVADGSGEVIPSLPAPGRLLHYESWSGEEFVRKWTNLISSGRNVKLRAGRRPVADAVRALIRADLPEPVLRRYLMRLYELTTEDAFETLRDLRLLDEIDPTAGKHQPASLSETQQHQLRGRLSEITDQDKRRLKSAPGRRNRRP